MTRWLVHDAYRHLAEAPEGFVDPWGQRRSQPFSLSPAVPEVETFLAGLYDELLPNFTSGRFNVGLDETFDLGQGRSAALIGAGSEDNRRRAGGRVYLDFLKRVHALVSQRGRTMLFWADIVQNHPELVREVPTDTVPVEWGYDVDHDFDTRCRRLSESDLSFLVAPGTGNWNCAGGRFDTARVNIAAAVDAAVKHGGEGILLTDWGDNGHLPPPLLSYPAIAFAGVTAWNAGADVDVFEWLDAFLLRDAGHELARGLRLLNTLHRHDTRAVPNASILGVALYGYDAPRYTGFIEATTPTCITDMYEQSREARRALERAVPWDQAGRNQQQELLFAADLALFALGVLLRHRNNPGDPRPDTEFRLCPDAREIVARLGTVRSYHFRPGGLEASAAVLTRLCDLFGDDNAETGARSNR
jgi:hypothetical protein